MGADAQGQGQVMVRREAYAPSAFAIPTVSLVFDLEDRSTAVEAQLRVERLYRSDQPLVLDRDECEVVEVAVDGVMLPPEGYRLEDSKLSIFGLGSAATITLRTRLDPAANTKLMGLYMSGGAFCTQCEAEGFRRIVPFLDRPDVMSRYTVTLRADKARFPVLLANGNFVAEKDLFDGRHEAVWHDPHPKPCYLFAVVAGDLAAYRDRFITASGRSVDLAIWVRQADLPRCAHAMAALIKSMRWDEERFGREYDLDQLNIVAVSDFNFGAMENKGLNIFNSRYILADAETATDADFDAVEAVVAHEYFHNWTGNRVTCRDWFQLSLKEGLTVYRDQEFSADMGSRAVKRIDDVRLLRAVQFQEDAGPLAHPVRPDSYQEISNFYTATIYNKGAEVIRMMATLLGPDKFHAGMDLYFARHDGQAVTCDDFVAAMEAASGIDLGQFRLWYQQAGTPQLTITIEDGGRVLRVQQHVPATPGQSDKRPMPIPLRWAVFDRTTGRRVGDEQVTVIDKADQQIDLPDVDAVPSLLRGFSAPVALSYPYSRADLAFLAGHDDDPFARWESMQRLALDLIQEQIARAAAGAQPQLDDLFVDAIAATLAADEADPALVADAVLLPSESYIGDQQQPVIDVDAIHQVRQRFRQALGAKLKDQWLKVYHSNYDADYAFTPAAKARRRLKNVALQYLMVNDDHDSIALCALHYFNADNMTDAMAAMTALASSNAVERDDVLAHFYKRWQGNTLVIDKWFTVQALSMRSDTLRSVTALARHPDFTLANPNRLRSLVNAFTGNQVRFHTSDGAGYRFLADHVLAVDRINPQAAARLVAPLGRWRRFDEARSGQMRLELERIIRANSLSADVREMVSKSLAG
jgi:aminopeptidase N